MPACLGWRAVSLGAGGRDGTTGRIATAESTKTSRMQDLKSLSLWGNTLNFRTAGRAVHLDPPEAPPNLIKKLYNFVSFQGHGGGMRAARRRSDVASAIGKRTEFQDRGAGRAS